MFTVRVILIREGYFDGGTKWDNVKLFLGTEEKHKDTLIEPNLKSFEEMLSFGATQPGSESKFHCLAGFSVLDCGTWGGS